MRELAVASLIETLSTFAHQKFSRYPALVMSVHLNGSSELRPSRKSSGKGFLPEEFMSPAVPIDFISHELSLLSVYLGITLINLALLPQFFNYAASEVVQEGAIVLAALKSLSLSSIFHLPVLYQFLIAEHSSVSLLVSHRL